INRLMAHLDSIRPYAYMRTVTTDFEILSESHLRDNFEKWLYIGSFVYTHGIGDQSFSEFQNFQQDGCEKVTDLTESVVPFDESNDDESVILETNITLVDANSLKFELDPKRSYELKLIDGQTLQVNFIYEVVD